jgi:DNA-binding MarR family transcriptional regulator
MAADCSASTTEKLYLAHEVAQLVETTVRLLYEGAGPSHVHRGQWLVLRYLMSARPQDRTIGSIAAYLGTTSAPVSRCITALVRQGWVSVCVGESDRRQRRIDLTDSGEKLLAADPIRLMAQAMEMLRFRDMQAFGKSLDFVRSELARAQAGTAPRLKSDVL